MEWDEFNERAAERRRNRRTFPRKPDRVTVAIGAALLVLLGFWIVWGVTA